jgi:hypothetical protein
MSEKELREEPSFVLAIPLCKIHNFGGKNPGVFAPKGRILKLGARLMDPTVLRASYRSVKEA